MYARQSDDLGPPTRAPPAVAQARGPITQRRKGRKGALDSGHRAALAVDGECGRAAFATPPRKPEIMSSPTSPARCVLRPAPPSRLRHQLAVLQVRAFVLSTPREVTRFSKESTPGTVGAPDQHRRPT